MVRATAETTIIDMTEPVSVILTNESQGFATDIDRIPLENLEFYTDIIVYRGDTELTDFSVGSVASANGITVTVNKNRVAFSINTSTAITADNGTFIIPVNVEGTTISRIFSWSCSKQGKSAISYLLEASTLAIKKGYDNVFAPATITFSAFYRIGTNAERIAYPGRFVISESTDGISYTDQYTSTTSELSTEYTPSSTDVKTIKCVLYAAGSNINALDTQSVVILTDVDNIQPDLDKLKEELKTEISGVKSEVDKANKKITDEVWKDTIIETKDADGNTVQTTIENLLIQNTTDLNGIHTTLSDVQTVVNGSEDGSTIGLVEKVTTIEETVDGVETTVTEKYAELDGKISNTNTQVKQHADTITATAKKADDNGEEIASLKLTTQGLSVDIADAAKTATNFLNFSADGLQVGNRISGEWEGCRAQMTGEAYKILDADGTELASYGADLVELGKDKQTSIQISNEGYKIVDISGIELASFNSDKIKLGALSEDASIELCGGLGSITYYQDGIGHTGLEISSNETVSINSGEHSSLSVDYLETDDSNVVTSIVRSGFDASSGMARLYFEEDEIDEYGGILNTWVAHAYAQRGTLNLEADNINLETPIVNVRYELSAQQIRLNNMLLSSFVTETGTDGIWTYRKWSDGTAECWGQYTATMNFTGSSGVTGLLVGDVGLETDFPTDLFVETPRCYSKYHGASKSGTTYASFDYIASDTLSSTHTHKISVLRIGSSVSGLTAKADFYAIGKWSA